MEIAPLQSKIRRINQAGYVDQRIMESRPGLARGLQILRRNFLSYYFVEPPMWRVMLRARLSKDRMLPAFFSLGALRSGTSLLADYIMQHPCVVLPLAKEIGVGSFPHLQLIKAQFPSTREAKAVEDRYGKAITGYCTPGMPHLGLPYLAAEVSPAMKFIIMLRDPVERTFAHWRWDQVLLGHVKHDPLWRRYPDFDTIVRLELESIDRGGGGVAPLAGTGTGGYIQHSIYAPFVRVLLSLFERKNVLFVNASDFFTDPRLVAREVYEFLELPKYQPVEMPLKNAGPKGEMSPATRELLSNFFRPMNEETSRLVGRDLGW